MPRAPSMSAAAAILGLALSAAPAGPAGILAAPAPDGAAASAPAPVEEPMAGDLLTLDRALEIALAGNRLLANASIEVGRASDLLGASRSSRYPTLQLRVYESKLLEPLQFGFERGVFGNFPGTGPIPDSDTTIESDTDFNTIALAQIHQPISQLRRIGLGVKLRALSREVAREEERGRRQSLRRDVTRAWHGIAAARSALAAKAGSVAFHRELSATVGRTAAQRAALEADVLEVKARLAMEERDLLVMSNVLATRKEQLNLLLGRDVRTPFSVGPAAEPEAAATTLEEARRIALERRPEAREARLHAEQAETDLRLKRAEYIPDLSLSLSYVRLFEKQVLPPDIAAAGVLLSWEPLDWGKRRREVSEKAGAAEQAANGVRETESAILVEVGDRFRKLEESRLTLAAARAAREAALEKLRVATERHAREAILLKDLLQARAEAAEAEAQVERAVSDLWSATVDLEGAMGVD